MNRNSLTLFAVLALSVSNLFVGISTQNKPLILASAAISAALAIFYIAQELIGARRGQAGQGPSPAGIDARETAKTKVPVWVFIMIMFIILPAIMWALLTTQP